MDEHVEHRKRVFERFTKNGFLGLAEHEKLEIILFYSVPRINTNDIAHKLLDRYKTIAKVMDAPEEELIKFKHITQRTVQLFKLIKETSALYTLEKGIDKVYMTSTDEFGTYFQILLGTLDEERMAVLCLNSKGKILNREILRGGNSAVAVNTRKLLEVVLRSKATEVVIAHNHPGELPFPSENDVETTIKLKYILSNVGVYLKDHFIVTNDDYCSMAKSPQYNKIFTNQKS